MSIEEYLEKECRVNPDEKISTSDDSYWKLKDIIQNYIEEEELVRNLSLGGVTKRLFHFDYVARTYLSEFNRVGEVVTEYIKAYDKEHAILLFKEKHGDTPFDPPY